MSPLYYLFVLRDRIAAFFGYVPVARLERARQTRNIALWQAAHERQHRAVDFARAQELERTVRTLEAEVAELRQAADRVRA